MLVCVTFAHVDRALREEKFQKKQALIPFSLLLLVVLECLLESRSVGVLVGVDRALGTLRACRHTSLS